MKDVWLQAVWAAMNGVKALDGESEVGSTSRVADLAMAHLLHRAATPLRLALVRPIPLPLPTRRAICPEAVVSVLAAMVRQEHFHVILPEFLALLARRRWRLPPEWLPQVLEVALQEKMLTLDTCRSLGPLALWLAWQHPRWKSSLSAPKNQKRRHRPRWPECSSSLKIRWPDLSPSVWERCVLALARSEQAWASTDSALVAALTSGQHTWPITLLPLWGAHLDRAKAKQVHQAPSHESALIRAAALRASPEPVLEILGDASEWPYAWRDIWTWARDVASFRLRMHQAFQ
ncbi:MAG: hypothetical protein RMJ33_11265 [Saprospiraceae bacterium]|nr:hypothetical protein [Saprospiraceae bacterium]MDW8230407.1 hypothetical protein [Saprospiraceae bacterium]